MMSASSFSSRSFRLSATAFMLVTMGVFGVHLRAQEDTGSSGPKAGYVDDWTHHHLIFSNPGSRDDAARNGTLDKWLKVTNDPRYQLQQIKRNLGPRPVIADWGSWVGVGEPQG